MAPAPRRTAVDAVLGAPIALLALPTVRVWMVQKSYFQIGFVFLILARVVHGAWHRGANKQLVRSSVGIALQRMMPVVECSRLSDEVDPQRDAFRDQLRANVVTVLKAVVDLTVQSLHIPAGIRVAANLMVPMDVRVKGQPFPRRGCGVVAYNVMPPDPGWTRLAGSDLGAASALESGKVQVVEDTTDPEWCGVFDGSRAKSFASFPIRAGTTRVIAVLNVDANQAMVFSPRTAEALFIEVLAPALKLLGDLLFSATELVEQCEPEAASVF